MQAAYRQQLEEERSKVTALTAKLLLKFDGDRGTAEYLRLSSDAWLRSCGGVSQKLCDLSSSTEDITISNLVFEPGSSMAPHRHSRQETIFVLDGDLCEEVTGEILRSPAMKNIEPNAWHGWSSKKGALATVVWRPALCSDDGIKGDPRSDEDC